MTQQVLAWPGAREDRLRAHDRARISALRATSRMVPLFAALAGPGILVMLGENDGPSMLSYAATGASYGVGFFLPFIILTFVLAYIVQEMVVRIGIATGRGHGELIFERFGSGWGWIAIGDLAAGNFLTLVTEFIAIAAGAAYFGVAPQLAIPGAVAMVALAMAARRYATWERTVLALAAVNVVFVPVVLFAHPDLRAVTRAFAGWGPIPGGLGLPFFTLILANIGATVTPWMLFFQQNAVVDKGLSHEDLPAARLDTATGAGIAAIVAIAAVVTTSVLFTHHVGTTGLVSGADFATALRPFIGSGPAALFALGMIEAGLVAAMTISGSSAYGLCEALRYSGSFNSGFAQGWRFYAIGLGSSVLAGAIVLIPHAPLLAISIIVNVLSMMLMAPALLFVLLLAGDQVVMGQLRNSRRASVIGGSIVVAISLIGATYALVAIAPLVGWGHPV